MDFSKEIIKWYRINKRDLPWRKTRDPYKIWISEIILQQTKVNQGRPYYERFIKRFPTIQDLAKSSQDDVLKLWQGLGYYSRARNLHFSANMIMQEFSGKFPENYTDILKLKGIGEYTAAAIASFCFSLPYAVVDGNVIRLLSRFFGINIPFDTSEGKRSFQQLANRLLDKNHAATHNQAIMEFGSLQCKPKTPSCQLCNLKISCIAFSQKSTQDYPVRRNKIKTRNRFLHFFIINNQDNFFIRKRKKGVWKGLYEFPLLEFKKEKEVEKVLKSPEIKSLLKSRSFRIKKVSEKITYLLSHQRLHVRFWHINSDKFSSSEYDSITLNKLKKLPVPNLIDKYLESFVLGWKK